MEIDISEWHYSKNNPIRVELGAHTNLSDQVAGVDISRLRDWMKSCHHTRVGVADFNSVRSFPKFSGFEYTAGPDPIFGMDSLLQKDSENSYAIKIYVKNQTGLKNLYRLVGKLHQPGRKYQSLSAEEVSFHKKGLLIGSAGAGEVFLDALENFDPVRVADIIWRYDFVEIFPPDLYINTELAEIIARPCAQADVKQALSLVADVGRQLDCPVFASGNVYSLLSKPAVRTDSLAAPGKMRSPGQMLEAFDFLGAGGSDVVLKNTRDFARKIGKTSEPDDDSYPSPCYYERQPLPADEVAYSDLDREIFRPVYCDNQDIWIVERRNREKRIFKQNFARGLLDVAALMNQKITTARSGRMRLSSHTAFFEPFQRRLHNINPLPPHYRCPDCDTLIYQGGRVEVGLDLDDKNCSSCGASLLKQGTGINPQLAVGEKLFGYFSYSLQSPRADIEMDDVAFYFTLNKLLTWFNRARLLWVHRDSALDSPAADINSTSFYILPRDCDVLDTVPVETKTLLGKEINSAHFDLAFDPFCRVNLSRSPILQQFHKLEQSTGQDPFEVRLNPRDLLNKLLAGSFQSSGISGFSDPEFQQILKETNPDSIAALIRLKGLQLGEGTWEDNAETLLKKENFHLQDLIVFPEDIVARLIDAGVDYHTALASTRDIYLYGGERFAREETIFLHDTNLPEWFFNSVRKIKKLCPREQATQYILDALRLAHFQSAHKSSSQFTSL